MYKRNCPKCGLIINHKTKKSQQNSIKRKKNCISCAQKIAQSGEKNGMFGKKHTLETKKKIREKRKSQKFSIGTRKKMSISAKKRMEEYNHWLGRKHSEETKNKMRLISSERIRNNQWHPSYNITACEIINKYGKENGYNFQHAMNGGEFYIEKLGYWVDGYDGEKNVVIEYYENEHKYTVDEDKKRINKIKKTLNCEVIILKEWEEKKTKPKN